MTPITIGAFILGVWTGGVVGFFVGAALRDGNDPDEWHGFVRRHAEPVPEQDAYLTAAKRLAWLFWAAVLILLFIAAVAIGVLFGGAP